MRKTSIASGEREKEPLFFQIKNHLKIIIDRSLLSQHIQTHTANMNAVLDVISLPKQLLTPIFEKKNISSTFYVTLFFVFSLFDISDTLCFVYFVRLYFNTSHEWVPKWNVWLQSKRISPFLILKNMSVWCMYVCVLLWFHR